MDLPAFAKRRTDLVWARHGRTLTTSTPEVAFTAHRPWYSLGRWTVTAVSPLALPANVTLCVTSSGSVNGYFHNASIGLPDYFGYCDAPALMPLLVGPRLRDALGAHDYPAPVDGETPHRNAAVLHVRNRQVETTTKTYGDDSGVLDAITAIHRSLADDHADLLDRWKAAADELRGTIATSWPPVLTVPRGFGSTTIALRWSPSLQAGSQASIELTTDAHGVPLWSMEREPHPTPNARMIGDRPFLVMGTIPIPIEQVARVVARADITSIIVRRHATVRIARHTPDPDVLDAVLDLLGHVCGANSEPYR